MGLMNGVGLVALLFFPSFFLSTLPTIQHMQKESDQHPISQVAWLLLWKESQLWADFHSPIGCQHASFFTSILVSQASKSTISTAASFCCYSQLTGQEL